MAIKTFLGIGLNPGLISADDNWSPSPPAANEDDAVISRLVPVGTTITGTLAPALKSLTIEAGCDVDFGAAGTPVSFTISGSAGSKVVNDQGAGTKYLKIAAFAQWNIRGGIDYIQGAGAAGSVLQIDAEAGSIYGNGDAGTPLKADTLVVKAGTVEINEYWTTNASAAPNLIVHAGSVVNWADIDNAVQYGGTVVNWADVDAPTIHAGTWYQNGASITGAPYVVGTLSFALDGRARMITELVTLRPGASLLDPLGVVTFTAGWTVAGGTLQSVMVNVGPDRTYTVT